MRVKLLGEKEDQKKREVALRDTVKELEQQHSDLTVIFYTVSHSILQSNRAHCEGTITVQC